MIAKQIDLNEAVELLKDAWGHMPTRLQAAIVTVMRESIENGETFIKTARKYESTDGSV